MKSIRPADVSARDFYSYMVGAVVPRPIAFVSSISAEGRVNLSPYSFFNAVSAKPPILIFAPVNSMRDGSTKNTLDYVLEHDEVVINIVNHTMLEQMSLASTAYPKGVNEFAKSGLTEAASQLVKPPRVAESPVAFECKVKQVIPLGDEGGAGNLVICEVLLVHIHEEVLDEKGNIHPQKLNAIGRMGGSFYCRASGDAVFEVIRPIKEHGIGVDQLPEAIRKSSILTGSNLAKLATVAAIPDLDHVQRYAEDSEIQRTLKQYSTDSRQLTEAIHRLAQQYLDKGDTDKAWGALILALEHTK
ncbi:flavin reductase (DIM6/NTAB) family NADH-FMN oxidoreductase RutF [Catalinimonas alkaloidigena]|uniref:flavin reductase family protein n=1 Tax=Catalinimonas alkaloidigena TaxID=1075417 RepID=UPI00240571D9|nr:flavin reductase family protein [Catalinimonas alkaloidigena]MDF9800880.1 flavin reductase (DIM6/NTAB) family NADH-FMN oxidoreductase RutF [Catalinimonas alkaloidigena]